jgi:large subunit ribosomal protein L30
MSQILVTQVRSSIGGTDGQRNTLRSLGLKHVGDSVVKDDRPEFRGMVAAVAHLVTVEEVSQ